MLAELVAANAAYATIKTFVLNGKETTDVLSPLKNLVTAEEELRAWGNRKKHGLFSKVLGKAADDFDEFLALEQMAEKRKELESICRLYAPIGTWDRFIEYEAKMRKQRKREAEERQRQIAQTIRYISWGLITAISLGGLSLLYFFTEFLRGFKCSINSFVYLEALNFPFQIKLIFKFCRAHKFLSSFKACICSFLVWVD